MTDTKNNSELATPVNDRIIELISRGIDAWLEAGKLIAECIDKDPDWPDKLHEKHPEISVETLYAFERVGRRELHPRLLVCDSPGAKRLRRLPYRLQEQYLTANVPLLVKTPKGWESLHVSVHNLTPAQAEQVIGADNIRPADAQRTWLEDKAAALAVAPCTYDVPWRVVKQSLIITERCKLTRKDLLAALQEME